MDRHTRSSIRRRTPALLLALTTAMTLAACGGSDDESSAASDSEKPDHVWKDKTQAIDKARDVQRVLDESKK